MLTLKKHKTHLFKLLIPWRFFRLWALLDGVDAPENMVRCMANNYSTLAFWRSWHRSYNLWIVRSVSHRTPLLISSVCFLFLSQRYVKLKSTYFFGRIFLATVRYIYLPLGGSKNLLPSTVLVFTFVALWHDLSLRLLYWGWLVSLFVIPEVVATKLVTNSTVSPFHTISLDFHTITPAPPYTHTHTRET